MRTLFLGIILIAGNAAAQQSPYYGITQSTTTGKAAGHISGTWGVAASSQTPTTYNVYLDGVNGRVGVNMGSAPLYPLDLNGYGVLRSSAAVYGTLGIGWPYATVGTAAKLNINSQGGYAMAMYPGAGLDGFYFYPIDDNSVAIRATGGSTNLKRLLLGNTGSSYGAMSLNVYGGDQGTYPGIALRGKTAGAEIAIANGDTTGNWGGWNVYVDNNGKTHFRSNIGGGTGGADYFPGTEYGSVNGSDQRVFFTQSVNISSDVVVTGITFSDGTRQTSAAASLVGYAALAATQTFSGLNTFNQRVNVSSDVVVAGVTFADTTRQTSAGVPTTRAVNTSAPLSGGGALSGDLTLTISSAGATSDGYLKQTDWNSFNNKLATPVTSAQVDSSIRLSTDPVNWTDLQNYPTSCSAGDFVSAVGDTLTCATPAGGGDALKAADNNWSATQTFQSSATVKDGNFSVGGSTFNISGGSVSVGNVLQFGTTPTVGAFKEGKLYYDATNKTLSADIDTDVTLQLGQENMVLCKNATGVPITNGTVVYITGADSGVPTIAAADAHYSTMSYVLGVVTNASIDNGATGMVTIFGNVNDLNTNSWAVGTQLYLSSTTPGALTSTPPSEGGQDVRVGRVTIQDSSVGRVFINVQQMFQLTDAADVTISTPTAGQTLIFNGLEWVNGSAGTVSAGPGINFYFNGTHITESGSQNSTLVETLSKEPWTASEDVESTSVTNSTVLAEAYVYDTALGRTTIDAGPWEFFTWTGVNRSQGVSQLLRNVMRVRPSTGTITSSDVGTSSRTFTSSDLSAFVTTSIDVGGTLDSDSYIQTSKGLYRILNRISNSVVQAAVPSTYTNEVSTFSVHKRLFQVGSDEINNIVGAAPTYTGLLQYTKKVIQPAFTTLATDKLAVYRFAKATDGNAVIIYFAYGGADRYSYFNTPLTTLHNNLPGLQGGTGSGVTSEFYHNTAAQQTAVSTLTSDLAAKVSYTNATGNVDLNGHSLTAAGVVASTVTTTSTGTFAAISVTGAAEFQKPVNVSVVYVSSTCAMGGAIISCTADCQDSLQTGYSAGSPYLHGFMGSAFTGTAYPPYSCAPINNHSIRCSWEVGTKTGNAIVYIGCSKQY